MAATYTAYFNGITFAASKVMAGFLNGHASELIKIRRVGLLNAQTAAVVGVICQLELRFYPATMTLTGGTSVTPTKHDSTNANATTLTISHNSTPAGSTGEVLRRVWWSSDEPAISTGTVDEMEANVPMNIVFDPGYGDSNIQPLTLRQNQGFVVFNTTGAVGLLDTWVEYTLE